MSLKAKLEAVIYATEEPVTLAQLSALFGEEALEWKAQQAPATAQPCSPTEETASSALALAPGADVETPSQNDPASEAPLPGEAPAAESNPEAAADAGGESAGAAARRLARQRDREARTVLRGLLDELIAEFAADGHGIEIREIAGGYRMATKPEFHDAVRSFVKSLKPPLKLSLPALETLAVIAYKQPVTAPEVNEIRGVDSSGVFGSLLARKLIATAGRKPVIGRPILYKTTREFLLRFGLKDLNELPSMEEFEKMAALELEEPESAADDTDQPAPPDANPRLTFDSDAAEPAEEQPNAAPAQPPPVEDEDLLAEAASAEPAETEPSSHDR